MRSGPGASSVVVAASIFLGIIVAYRRDFVWCDGI